MKRDLGRALALTLVLAAVFCLAYGRTSPWAMEAPIHYAGDSVSFLAYLKAARDGEVVPVAATTVANLNAPYEANWNDYPRPQKTFFWLAGHAARSLGVFLTANLLLLLAHILAGLAFFGVARYLRCRPAFALVGAASFACSHYIWYRSLSHLALSLYWHIPLCALVAGWCFRRHGLAVRSRRFAMALLVAVVAAAFNVYYAAMFAQLLGFAALAHLARGTWRKAAAPLLLAAAVIGLFALESLGTLQYPLEHGRNLNAVSRSYGDLEHYALKPLELLVPRPEAGLIGYGRLAQGYWTHARGEVGSAYLGLLAIAGLAGLFVPLARGLLRGRRIPFTQGQGAVLWILAFSVVGGANGILGSLGVVLLRGTNRYSIWIVAVALLHLVKRLSRRPTGRPLALAAGLAVVAVLDQVPRLPEQGAAWQRDAVAADRAFADRLEAAVLGRGMVFMLPVLAFPEGGAVRQMHDYEHFRPYLYTSSVRYSYGTDKGRPREDWQWRVQAMAPAKMVDRLESYGFSGLLVDRRAYLDGGRELLGGLAAAGRPITIDEEGRGRAFVRLQPRAPARLPETSPQLGAGWYGRPQAGFFWAYETRAEWRVTNPTADPMTVRLGFELTSVRPRPITLRQGERVVASWHPEPSVTVADLAVELPPGESLLLLTTDGEPDVTEIGNRLRPAAFAVKDVEMREE